MRAGWIAVALLLACVSLREPGRIQVEVYRGLVGPSQTVGAILPDVHILLDATLSMSEPSGPGASHLLAARTKATELVRALPAGTQIELHAYGQAGAGAAGAACAETELLSRAADRSTRRDLIARLRDVTPAAEASGATALETLARELTASGRARDSRVVLFTDLEPSCGGDLCAAAAALVSASGWLDVVVHGDAVPPSCLADLEPRHDTLGSYVRSLSGSVPTFRIEPRPGTRRSAGGAIARGSADGAIANVPAGDVDVIIELDPPARLGPVRVEPGRLTRVRVLAFGGSTGDWRWEIVDDGA